MKRFKDQAGRDWDVVVNVGVAKRVRDLTKVDIFNLFNDEAGRVFSDPCLLVDVLYVVLSEQCRKAGVSDEQFGLSLYGDVLETAATALLEEVADFFPQSRRSIMKAAILKSEQMSVQMQAKALEIIDKIDLSKLIKSPES